MPVKFAESKHLGRNKFGKAIMSDVIVGEKQEISP
jgi:hypothetical protein